MLSLIYETARQNWPLLKQLGRTNSLAMLGRTFNLWSPTLLLIATGLWISHQITSGTEQVLYDQDVVTPYCLFHEAKPDAYIECPNKGLTLDADDVYEVNLGRTAQPGEPARQCSAWRERYVEIVSGPMPAPFGCPEAILDPVQYTLSQAPFFVSLDMTVARKFDVEEWRLNNHMSSVQEATLRNSQSARRIVFFARRSPTLTSSVRTRG